MWKAESMRTKTSIIMPKSDRLGMPTMDKIFGKGKWSFTTIANKADSLVTKKHHMEELRRPFLHYMMKLEHNVSFIKMYHFIKNVDLELKYL